MTARSFLSPFIESSPMRTAPLISMLLTLNCVAGTHDNQQPLTPEEAAKKVDQQVTIQMQVRSSGGNRNRYLNSRPDFAAADNFTIFIPEAAVPSFVQAKIERPEEHFYGKTIQVTGTVTLFRL